SATVGRIPNFGQTSQSRGSGNYDTGEKRGLSAAPVIAATSEQRNGLAFRPALAVFINQSGSLGLIRVLDPYLRRWPTGLLRAGGTRPSRDSSPSREGAIREWACGPRF